MNSGMNSGVNSGVTRARSLPPGGTAAMTPMSDGWPLRSITWPGARGGPGTIVLAGGRGDFIEKYAEGIWAFVEAGWCVFSFDWRGQGLSGRVGKTPMHGDVPGGGPDGFDIWASDLAAITAHVRAALPGPHMIVAHSMGGHLALRHLAAAPGDYARAVLLSPMAGVRAPPLGPLAARILARAMVALGRGRDFVPGAGPYRPGLAGSARQMLLTTDAQRYADEAWWCAQDPRLAIGGVTWGWLDAAFVSMARLQERLPAIAAPIAIHMPAHDGLVDSAATRRMAAVLRHASLAEYPHAGHELLRERDEVRCAVLAASDAFLRADLP